jgi:hypothetical protein
MSLYLGRTANQFTSKLYKPFGRKIFENTDRIIAISNYEKQLLFRDFAIEEDTISVIPPRIHLATFSNLEMVLREPKTNLCIIAEPVRG